jgi:hypothetical protein
MTHTWSLAASDSPAFSAATRLIAAITARRTAWVGCSRGGKDRLYPGLLALVSSVHGQFGLFRDSGVYVPPPAWKFTP